jgi:hypothetical protein
MIKLKKLIKSDKIYDQQKYVVLSPKLRSSLKELFNSEDYKNASLDECILLENFTMIAEWVSLNKDDLYNYKKTGICWYEFIDKNNIIHEIRLLKNVANGKYEVKWWFIDKDNKPNYSPPNVYANLKYDTRIFNTHIYILLKEIIPYFFKNLPNEKLFLPSIDKSRYRLYRITLNNHLDKTKYSLEDLGNNLMAVSLIIKK